MIELIDIVIIYCSGIRLREVISFKNVSPDLLCGFFTFQVRLWIGEGLTGYDRNTPQGFEVHSVKIKGTK